jgi:ribosomal protein S18 acetylase RimI-like enzyme
MDIIIRKATDYEAETVAGIGRKTFYETWKSVNTEEDLQLYMNLSFDPVKIKKELENDAVNTFLLALADDEVAGYAKLRNDRTYDQLKGMRALEMERIYVTRKFQDHKVGKALMDKSISLAKEGKYEWLWLGVNQENDKAINFYKKYGFEIFGTKQFILGHAVDEDFLMKVKVDF